MADREKLLDPTRGYAAALPHLRAARYAYLAAISELENPCDEIFTHKWLDPACVGGGCQSLTLERACELLAHLTFMARSSGGVAGPDAALMAACEEAETFLAPDGNSAAALRARASGQEVR